ncbi:hypothetical protein BH09VER1_BH09VER1_23320 [soil metagenome]
MTPADRQPRPFASEDPHQALLRAVRFCHPGWDLVGSLSFRPDVKASPSWKTWQDVILVPVILPQIFAAHAAASVGNLAGLAQCDAAVDAALPDPFASASRLSGYRMVTNFPAPPAEKMLGRYFQRVLQAEAPGHLAVLMAARAAVFHFPPAMAASSYCFVEVRGGLPSAPIAEWMSMVGDCTAAAQSLGGAALRAA